MSLRVLSGSGLCLSQCSQTTFRMPWVAHVLVQEYESKAGTLNPINPKPSLPFFALGLGFNNLAFATTSSSMHHA